MFEGLADIASAWRTILHISEWSGLSIGMLIAGAALFFYVPLARKAVIGGAVLVLVGWICVIHGDRVRGADDAAQYAEERKQALAAEAERKTMIEQALEAKYQPQLAAIANDAAEHKARAEANERKLASLPKTAAAHSCELGAAADRVPSRWQPR